MASQDQTELIRQAASLIKAGNREQAYQLLRQAARQNPGDWRAWWGLVHASPNQQERYFALQKTVQLNPGHEKAATLLQQARRARQQSVGQPTPPPSTAPQGQQASPQAQRPAAWEHAPGAPAEPPPWENPFEAPPAQTAAPGWETAYEPSGSRAGLADPFAAPAPRREPEAWNSAAYRVQPKAQAARQRSAGDRLVNAAIVFVAILVILALGAVLLTRLDLSSVTNAVLYGGAPNNFTGGDPYRTTGGGWMTVDGPDVVDRINGLNDAHNWAFEGRAGQRVLIVAEAIGETDPRIVLLDSDGSPLTGDDDSGREYGLGYWDSYLPYTLPYDGTYTVRVDVFRTGEFMLRVLSQ